MTGVQMTETILCFPYSSIFYVVLSETHMFTAQNNTFKLNSVINYANNRAYTDVKLLLQKRETPKNIIKMKDKIISISLKIKSVDEH